MSRSRVFIGVLVWVSLLAAPAQGADHYTTLVLNCGNANSFKDASCVLDNTAPSLHWICTWKSNELHRITLQLSVPACATLVIEPGTTVIMTGNHGLSVSGRLKIHADKSSPVLFARANGSWNGPDPTPNRGRWNRIVVSGGGQLVGNKLSGLTIQGATVGLELNGVTAPQNQPVALSEITIQQVSQDSIRTNNSRITASALTIDGATGDGIDSTRTMFSLFGSVIKNTDDNGIEIDNSTFVVDGTQITAVGSDGINAYNSNLTLTHSALWNIDNDSVGVDAEGDWRPVILIQNNLFFAPADGNAAAIYIDNWRITARVRFNTIDGSNVGQSGILALNGSGQLIGNIVVGFVEDNISFSDGFVMGFNNSFGAGLCNYILAGTNICSTPSADNLSENPHFRNRGSQDYRLGNDTPAKLFNAVNPQDALFSSVVAPSDDAVRNPRIGWLDMGAFENLILKSINPIKGPAGEIVGVDLTGFNFKTGETVLTLHLPGVDQPDAAITVNSSSVSFDSTSHLHTLSANLNIAPTADLGLRDVKLVNPSALTEVGKLANAFTVVSNPKLDTPAMKPGEALAGTAISVTISGSGFMTDGGDPTVTLGSAQDGIGITIVTANSTTITATITIPNQVKPGDTFDLTVSNGDGESATAIDALTIVKPNSPPGAPTLVSPANQDTVQTSAPTLVVDNSSDIDGDTLTYRYQLSTDPGFNNIVAEYTDVTEGTNQTSKTVDQALNDGATYYWRVLAHEAKNGGKDSAWSETWSFTVQLPTPVDEADTQTPDSSDDQSVTPDQSADIHSPDTADTASPPDTSVPDQSGDATLDGVAVDDTVVVPDTTQLDVALDGTASDSQQDSETGNDGGPGDDGGPSDDLGQTDDQITLDTGGKDTSIGQDNGGPAGPDTGAGGVTTLSGDKGGGCQQSSQNSAPFTSLLLLALVALIWRRRSAL